MLLLTRRPMMFLLGRGLTGIPLHPCCGPFGCCLTGYGVGPLGLEPNAALFRPVHPDVARRVETALVRSPGGQAVRTLGGSGTCHGLRWRGTGVARGGGAETPPATRST